jgi:hypothetical protein
MESRHEYNAKDDSPSSQTNFACVGASARTMGLYAAIHTASHGNGASADLHVHAHTSNDHSHTDCHTARMPHAAGTIGGKHCWNLHGRTRLSHLSSALL